jgi:hypothetical protein
MVAKGFGRLGSWFSPSTILDGSSKLKFFSKLVVVKKHAAAGLITFNIIATVEYVGTAVHCVVGIPACTISTLHSARFVATVRCSMVAPALRCFRRRGEGDKSEGNGKEDMHLEMKLLTGSLNLWTTNRLVVSVDYSLFLREDRAE